MLKHKYHSSVAGVLTAAAVIFLAGCSASSNPSAAAPVDAAEETHAAALLAKEEALAQREAAIALQEQQDQARREAELAAAKKPAPAKVAAQPSRAPAPSPTRTASIKPAVTRIIVPAGTQLTVALSSGLSTKTALLGDPFKARLVSDLVIDGRVAAPAGTRVTGSVMDVVSGSKRIGGVPTLTLALERLVLRDGQKIDITGTLVQQGKSDTGRDTAKILGGAAAGAIIGHQVDDDRRGTVIGGLLGGAAGAVAAKKTGTEVVIPAGEKITIEVGAPFEVVAAA